MRHQLPCDACARAGKVMVSMYRCPRCLRTSCSLTCVRAHKSHYSCDGVRDRAAPVPKRDYTEAHFISDYNLLEDARRAVDAANAAQPRNYRDYRAPVPRQYPDAIPRRRMELLAREAAKRGIDLRFMPRMYLRHRRNASDVRPVLLESENTPEKRPFDRFMIWSMEVVFWGRDGGTRSVKIADVDEDTPMKDVLNGALASLKIKKDRLSGKEDPYIEYLDITADKVTAFLKNETSLIKRLADAPIQLPEVYLKKNKRRKMADGIHVESYDLEFDTRKFHPVETGSSVRESLHGRSIVEYPIINVVVKGSAEEEQITSRLKDIFEKPEPSASDASDSEESDDPSKREDGELGEDEAGDEDMPDAPTEDKSAPPEASKNVTSEPQRKDVKSNSEGSRDNGDLQTTRKEVVKDRPIAKEEKSLNIDKAPQDLATPLNILQASAGKVAKKKIPMDSSIGEANPEQQADEKEDVFSPSLENVELLPPNQYEDEANDPSTARRRSRSGKTSPTGKAPIVGSDDSGSEYDADDVFSDNSDPEDQDETNDGSLKSPVSQGRKRQSRSSDSDEQEDAEEQIAEDSSEEDYPAKRQKTSTAKLSDEDSQEDTDEDSESEAEETRKPRGGKKRPGGGKKKPTKSPPLPFAFEYDSALLSDRIPRRKKLANSGGLQTPTPC